MRNISDRFLVPLCLGSVFAILFVGLWPFGYPIPNRATLLSDAPGIRFAGGKGRAKLNAGGVAYTPGPLTIQRTEHSAPGSMTLAVKAEAASEFTSGVGTIVAFCDEENRLKLLFGQWRTHLIIRTFYFATDRRGPYTEIGVRDVLTPGKPGLITVTSSPNGTKIFYDGDLARSVAHIKLLTEAVDFSGYRVYLGNEPDVSAPWNGKLYGLGIYDRALTDDEVFQSYRSWTHKPPSFANPGDDAVVKYTFANAKGMKVPNILGDGNYLLIPERFDLKQRPLERSIGYKINVEDVVINVLGFIPLGFLGVLWLRQRMRGPIVRVAVLVVLAGFAVSFGIEQAQAYLPTRNSSLLDLITNVIGTIFGVIAACPFVNRKLYEMH